MRVSLGGHDSLNPAAPYSVLQQARQAMQYATAVTNLRGILALTVSVEML